MRETDFNPTEGVRNYVFWRDIRTWGGFLITIAGLVFAFLRPDQATLGMIVALLGAGVIEPTQVMGFFTRR